LVDRDLGRSWGAVICACALLLETAGASGAMLPSAPVGLTESGVPAFVVLAPEAIGLSSVPTDLHILPDGRVLVVSQKEMAFGDGVRWETFRGAGGPTSFISAKVAVDQDGRIYAGANGQIARVELTPDARWQLTRAVPLPADEMLPSDTLFDVTVFPNMWYWHGGSGAILAWRPGQEARVVGHVAAIDRIIALGEQVFVSSRASGDLFQLGRDGATLRFSPEGTLARDRVTCSTPFAPGQLLVGTNADGLKIFDGTTFRPFRTRELLDNGRRINDVCSAGEGYFAAAVDTVGIVFFDREGRTVQMLDRSLDHRLARVQQLRYAPTGVLWALLNDGVARIEFPSPLSHFEPMVASSLAYARPLRHEGRLWLMADGRAMRGVYDAAGRLERFEEDMPPGRSLFTLSEVDGQLFGASDAGIYVREESGWRPVAAGIVNARVGIASTSQGQLYVARNECGWIKRTPRGYEVRRIPRPGLGDTYNAITDPAGITWLEMGNSRAGRIDSRQENPTVEVFGTGDGLVDGWVQIFVLDGAARFAMGSHLCRFDERTHRFVEDREFQTRFPQMAAWDGRPTTDASGRLWFGADGSAHFFTPGAAGGRSPAETVAVGFAVNEFTIEEDGVVWMWGDRRLVRFDPRMPRPHAAAPQAIITSVQFAVSNRRLFAPGPSLVPLPFTDNSLIVFFAAPADPFGAPVTFEILLEGAVTQWVSTGNVGSATFSRLKEGSYVFHVRPKIGDVAGTEARLAFTVQPPWYRTLLARVLYVLGALGVVVGAAWLSSYLEHREKMRLERVVTERTRELNATNTQLGRQIAETTEKTAALAASEERYRALNTELEERIAKRAAELSQRNAEIFQERSLLRTLIDNLPIAIYAKDTQCRKTLANPADLKNLGCATEADAIGKTDFDLFSKEDAARFVADDQAVLTSGQPVLDRQESFIDPEGRKHWLVSSKLPLRNQGGQIVGLIGIGRDITAHKQAEEALQQARDQLQMILDNVPDRIYFKDTQSRFLNLSKALLKRLGLERPEQAIGKTDFDFHVPEKAREFFEDEQRIIRTGEPLINKTEKQILKTGGIAWASVTKVPMRDQTGKVVGVVGINRDITEIKRAEEELEALNKKMLTLSRQAGMAEVATGVLHNVGNVLNSVNVSAGVVVERLRDSKVTGVSKLARLLQEQNGNLAAFLTEDERGRKVPAYLEQLAQNLEQERAELGKELDGLILNIDHLKEVVAMQQNYARVLGVVESVEVSELVEDAFKIHGGAYVRHGITVEKDYGKVPNLSVDKHAVLQILVNLLHNAKYACDAANRPDKRVTVCIRPAGPDRVRIEIGDNGIGIPAENLTRIFAQGFTTRKGGHGFGLHSGALAAKQLGGALTVRSDGEGSGAIFTLELPLCPPVSEARKA